MGLIDVSKMNPFEQTVEQAINSKRRADNCLVDINNALKKWRGQINPVVEISGMGIKPGYQIVPMPDVPGNS